MRLPRWYCPVGIARPAHLPSLATPMGCVAGVGPDATGGGTMFGGPFVPGEAGWVKTEAGWWVNLRGVEPQTLQVAAINPRIQRVTLVQGAQPSHWWQVPVLLSPIAGDDGVPVYQSALDRLWSGREWKEDAVLLALQDRVLAVALSLGTEGIGPDDATLVALCIDILRLASSATEHEMIAGEWISKAMLLRVLLATADIPLPASSP